MRRFVRLVDVICVLLVVGALMRLTPLSWFWFDPGQVIVGNGTVSYVPRIEFDREIKRPTLMRYQIVIRNLNTGNIVCDPQSAEFTYRPNARSPDEILLHEYWTGGNRRCWPLKPDTYIMETCWTAPDTFWGLAGSKTVCRLSNPFTITAE